MVDLPPEFCSAPIEDRSIVRVGRFITDNCAGANHQLPVCPIWTFAGAESPKVTGPVGPAYFRSSRACIGRAEAGFGRHQATRMTFRVHFRAESRKLAAGGGLSSPARRRCRCLGGGRR